MVDVSEGELPQPTRLERMINSRVRLPLGLGTLEQCEKVAWGSLSERRSLNRQLWERQMQEELAGDAELADLVLQKAEEPLPPNMIERVLGGRIHSRALGGTAHSWAAVVSCAESCF